MDLNFITDPEMAPRAREEIEILELALAPYSDCRRVKISIRLTPFAPMDRPNLEIVAINSENLPVGDINVIGAAQTRLTLTMHLREPEVNGEYTFIASLSYEDEPAQHQLVERIDLTAAISEEDDSANLVE
jgi:hypothetical protein